MIPQADTAEAVAEHLGEDASALVGAEDTPALLVRFNEHSGEAGEHECRGMTLVEEDQVVSLGLKIGA